MHKEQQKQQILHVVDKMRLGLFFSQNTSVFPVSIVPQMISQFSAGERGNICPKYIMKFSLDSHHSMSMPEFPPELNFHKQ